MTKKSFVGAFFLSIRLIFTIAYAHAGAALWTITPLSETHISIAANDSAIVSYNITNQSHKIHQLLMQAIPGVVPIISPTSCPSLFILGYQQSCRLDLSINGSLIPQNILNGPVICEQTNLNQCYQPNAANSLNVTKTPAITYTVGGSVFGLSGSLVLINQDNEMLTIPTDGLFTFTTPLPPGSYYQVSVQQQPASQLCSINHASGTITNTNVTNIVVNCSTNTRTLGGQVSGLAPSEFVELQDANAGNITVSSDGSFVFPTSIAQGAVYNVTVNTEPNTQTCTVANGSGTAGNSNITNIQVNCSTDTYTLGGSVSGLSGTLELDNNGGDNLILTANGSFLFSAPVADGSLYTVGIVNQPATQTCTINQGSGTINGANVTNVSISCAANTTTLISSINQLALSVTGRTEFGINTTPSSGLAREITITNTGAYTAYNLAITPPSWPSGTSSTHNCGTTLSSGSSCTITVTPGAISTSDGTNPCHNNRTAPIPGTIQITADNASAISTNVNVVVLDYGCLYQGGFVYAFDDTTANTTSVGGKVVSTTDQSTSMIWSSNSISATSNNVSDDLIPGIDQLSTSSLGTPSYSDFTTFFSTTYTNSPIPFNASSFLMCNGALDGLCNTQNILTYYNTLKTNNTLATGGSIPFTALAGPTNPAFYAAGLCQQTINGYSDWYLPAICEMGIDRINPINSGCGSSVSSPTLQNMQVSLINLRYPGSPSPLSTLYWSSTLSSDFTDTSAAQDFDTDGGNQIVDLKSSRFKVRCSRALTP